MKSGPRFTPGDAAACAPFFSLGILLLFGFLAYLQVGHWPLFSRPDPKELVLLGFRIGGLMYAALYLIAAPLSLLAIAAIGMSTLLHTLGDVVDRRWTWENQERHLVRAAVCVIGTVLFWSQFGSMLNWLLD